MNAPDPRHGDHRVFALRGCNCADCTHWNREFLMLRETILRINDKPYLIFVKPGDPLDTEGRWIFK